MIMKPGVRVNSKVSILFDFLLLKIVCVKNADHEARYASLGSCLLDGVICDLSFNVTGLPMEGWRYVSTHFRDSSIPGGVFASGGGRGRPPGGPHRERTSFLRLAGWGRSRDRRDSVVPHRNLTQRRRKKKNSPNRDITARAAILRRGTRWGSF